MTPVNIAAASADSLWCPLAEQLTLDRRAVHVWRACLDQGPSQVDRFRPTLAADERLRAERFYFVRDRERYIIARGILRTILGRYLNRAPESLAFSYGFHGKPALISESSVETIRFNISHSHGTALFAVTRAGEIGVDLELMREDIEVEQLADRFFSRQESEVLCALPSELRRRAFFHCWTRKEAYIKARGEGLSLPLDRFDVSLIPGTPAALLNTRPESNEALRWSLQDLTVTSGYVAALAVKGRGCSLSYGQWP